ncbi:TonB family protein [Parvibaculum sp.]|uniref:TonB family protein n=1 Tax=Parvibaculum sp. TaxID=2024848 RepID=UPI003210EEB2
MAAAGTIRLDPTDPLAPPPPSPRNRWNMSATVALGLLINVLVLVGLFLRLPDRPKPRPAEPEAISVDLVRQQPPQPKPQPQPEQKKAEEQKPQEQKKQEKQNYLESGGSPELKMGRAPKQERAPDKAPKPEAREKSKEPPKIALPDWALPPDGDVPKPDKGKTSSQDSGAPSKLINSVLLGEGGGDPYLNALRARIGRNVVYPSTGGGRRGTAVWQIAISHAGNVKGMKLMRSSGHADLDYAALKAIERSVPFDPLPNNYANLVYIVAPISVPFEP